MFYYLLANFLIGACLASHACVIYERLENGKDFFFSRSQCPSCGFKLSILDEIPIVSYMLLKGKCRYCQQDIPLHYFIYEIIGAFSFIKIDFSNLQDILTAIIFFCLMLAAIYDQQEQEFPLILLVPPAIIILFTKIQQLLNLESSAYLELLIIGILLTYFVLKKKMGSGDLLIYLIMALYFSPHFANLTLLMASLLLLSHYFFEHKLSFKKEMAFVPYFYLAMIIIYNLS